MTTIGIELTKVTDPARKEPNHTIEQYSGTGTTNDVYALMRTSMLAA